MTHCQLDYLEPCDGTCWHIIEAIFPQDTPGVTHEQQVGNQMRTEHADCRRQAALNPKPWKDR